MSLCATALAEVPRDLEALAIGEAEPVIPGGPDLVRRGEAHLLDGTTLGGRASELGVAPLLLQLALARGLTGLDDQRRAFAPRLQHLRPPDTMAGFGEALDLLEVARRQRWRVGVFGDYDVDGVCTATILTTFLDALGLETVARVAHRDSGYGFGVDDARAFADAGADLVLTGDCGTSDVDALGWLSERDIRTAVIDHHQVPECAPPTDAFINPHQSGCRFPFKGLCSAGVAFYLCAALKSRLAKRETGSLPDPRAWLDLVALATVCDMMPLLAENRVLVAKGLELLRVRPRPGLRALLEVATVEIDERLDEEHLGYKLGPRINAPGRLGPAEPSLRLLRARTAAEARPLAEQVEMLNDRRRRHSERTVAEAMALLAADPKLEARAGLVVAHQGWLPGIVGIAAAGVAEHHRKPALVLAIDDRGEARGSVRSIEGIDVRRALEACAPLLTRFGGHREAAGVALPANKVPELIEAFDAAVAEQRRSGAALGGGDVLVHDGPVELGQVDEGLCSSLRAMGPFGVKFEPPRFLGLHLRVRSVRVLKDKHLSLVLEDGQHQREAIAFGQAHHDLRPAEVIHCCFAPFVDRYRGVDRVRLQVHRLWRA